MTAIGNLTVDLIAQTASFNSNIEKAARNLDGQANRMNRALANVSGKFDGMAKAARAAGLVIAGAGIAHGIKSSLDYAASLGEVAQQLGVTTKDLQVYRAIATQVGVTQEEMDKGLAKLTVSIGQASLGAKKQNETFAALGISVRNAAGDVKTAGEIIPQLADKLSGVQDPARRAAVEVALLGRNGQKLDTLLAGGSAAIANMRDEAISLGLVLSEGDIAKADQTADKIEQLTNQLRVNIAREVAQNSDAILSLVNAMGQLVIMAGKAANVFTRFKLAQGQFEAWVNSNDPFISGSQREAYRQRAEQFRFARLRAEGKTDTNGSFRDYRAAPLLVTPRPAAPTVDLPEFLASGGGGGRSGRSGRNDAARAIEEAQRRAEAFANDIASLDRELLSVQRDNLSDVVQIAAIDRQMVIIEMDREKAAVQAGLAAGDLTKAQAEQLTIKNDQIRLEKLLAIDLEEVQRTSAEYLDIQLAVNDNDKEILQALESLALTGKDRRDIQLRLLDLEEKEERLRQEGIIAATNATDAQKEIARLRLATLEQLHGLRVESINRNTQGPMEAYLDEINRTPAEMDEAFQQIKVNGLQAFNDGLVDAIVNFKSLGDVARSVIQQILQDLIRLQIQQAISMVIGMATGAPAPNASLTGSISGAFAENPGIFASGGFVSGPGSSTSDSIPAMLSNGEYVIRADAVRRIGIGALNRLNTGSHPRFAMGGFVGRLPAMSFARNDNAPVVVNLTMQASGNPRADRESALQAASAIRSKLARLSKA